MSSHTEKPLRKDAERNRARVLEAAAELFQERGLAVTLNDVAHHAGVGVGTVYRRFPDKQQLIDELFEERIRMLASYAEQARDDPDPWHGLTAFLERAMELQAADRGFKDLVIGTPGGTERIARARSLIFPVVSVLVERAKESGQLREDFAATDMPVIQLLLSTIVDAGRESHPELWRRYLSLILQGARAADGAEPLGHPPIDASEVPDILGNWAPPRRR